jgi:hypothetical protein
MAASLLRVGVEADVAKKRPGLYENIHRAQKRAERGGRPVRKKGEPGAPTDKAFRKAKRTAKKRPTKAARAGKKR